MIYNKIYQKSVDILSEFRINQNYNVYIYPCEKDDNSESIKEIIDSYYNMDIELKYVLLIGDIEDVPTIYSNKINNSTYYKSLNNYNENAQSDISYGIIDNKLRLIVGRLHTGCNYFNKVIKKLNDNQKKSNISNQINKIINYEKLFEDENIKLNKFNNSKWRRCIVGFSNNSGNSNGLNGKTNNVNMKYEINKFNKYNYDADFINLDNEDFSINKLDEIINKGLSLIIYSGKCNNINLKKNINKKLFKNNKKYYLGIILGCRLNFYNNSDYLTIFEYLNSYENKGSIALVGSSTYQSFESPNFFQKNFNNQIINTDNVLTIGDLFFNSLKDKNVLHIDLGGDNIYPDIYYYHLYGDPCTRYILTKK